LRSGCRSNRLNQVGKDRPRLLYAAFAAARFKGYRIIGNLHAL
jgi:hypothetical protein